MLLRSVFTGGKLVWVYDKNRYRKNYDVGILRLEIDFSF